MKKLSTLFLSFLLSVAAMAEEKPFDISLHGFVAVDAVHNSRIGRTIRNEHIFLFPLPANIDARTGKDLNDRGNIDIDAAHSRFGLHIKGPTVNGISVFGLIEADFLGAPGPGDSNFRLRHAFIRLGYQDFSLIAGQTWHPMFLAEMFPQKVNTAVGVPMHPLSRNPQLRLTWKANETSEFSLSLIEQNNFKTIGMPKGSEYSQVPEVVLQLKIGTTGPAFAAVTAGYKRLAIPDAVDSLKTNTMVNGVHAQASFRYKFPQFTLRTAALYGENSSDLAIPGGVGRVKGSTNEKPEFASLATGTLWADINSDRKKWDPGFFVGYMKALGAAKEVTVEKAISPFHPEVTNVVSVAPRIKYHVNPYTWIAFEYMYTEAAWGNAFDGNGVPVNLKYFANHRTLLSFRYHF